MKNVMVLLFSFVLLFSVASVNAQSYEDYLGNILENVDENSQTDFIKRYTQPLSTALGTSLGSALYHRGYTKGLPRFDVGISAAYVQIPDADKSFGSDVTGQNEPTFFGSSGDVTSGIDQDFFAMPMLHANVGLLANLEATVRFAMLDMDNLGKITLYGGGLKYGLSELIPLNILPIDFSVQAAYHKFTIGEVLDAATFSMNFQSSLSVPILPLDVYAGIGFDNSTMIVKTDALDIPNVGDVTIDGENKLRLNLGVSFTFLLLNVHADYNIGYYNSLGAGVMIVL